MLYYRHRRSHFSLAEPSPLRRALRPALGIALAIAVLYVSGSWLLQRIGIGNRARQAAVHLTVERRGGVEVSLNGKEFVNAQDALKLYGEDRVRTILSGVAALTFFDGTVLRLGERSDLTIESSDLKTEHSVITVTLSAGSLWVSTPATSAFSGSIVRTVATDVITYEIPAETDAVLSARSAAVYAAAGLGIRLDVPGAALPIVVGEGQQIALPEDINPDSDLYRYRSAIASLGSPPPFVADSRALYGDRERRAEPPSAQSGAQVPRDKALTIAEPEQGAVVRTATVVVRGTAAFPVTGVRVNGYMAAVDQSGSFALEVTLPEAEKVAITVEGLNARGEVVETALRELSRDLKPPAPPAITAPAASGQTYRTQRTEVEIRGTAPVGTAGIMVNDYRLQLFKKGDTAWSYLASVTLGNYVPGINVFAVTAVDDAGRKSEPVTVTLLMEEGTEGIVDAGTSGTSSATAVISEDQLPAGPPLEPGTVRVTAPVAGTQYTATGAFLLEGSASPSTETVWVNGYRLRLYTPGKSFWNYLADPALGTLSRGVNTYRINARDREGKLLDTTTYTVTY